jgi:hypothetical protein
MEVKGKIKVLNAEQQVTASFVKRELVIVTEDEYPQFISINFVQDKTELLDRFKVGDEVTVSINLKGREWVNPQGETKYFNDIQGWRITADTPQSRTTNPNENTAQTQTNPNEMAKEFLNNNQEEDPDLPF